MSLCAAACAALLACQTEPEQRLSVDLSLTAASDYYFRGIVQRTDTLNLQPAVELGWLLAETGGASWKAFAGSWSNHLEDNDPGAGGSSSDQWYEHDAWIGLAVGFERFSAEAYYTWYDSPSEDFTEVQDLTVTGAFDDEGLWSFAPGFALLPAVSYATETDDAASGPDSGKWLGLSADPGASVGLTPLGALRISAPASVGLSLDDYYQLSDGTTETFGYAEVGLRLYFELEERSFLGASAWDVAANWLHLDGVLDDLNGGDEDELWFRITLLWNFKS